MLTRCHSRSQPDVALAYIEAVQRARRGDIGASWNHVADLLDPDFEIRLAGYGSELWRNPLGREDWLARLSNLPWEKLQTETLNVFGNNTHAAAEQVSTFGLAEAESRKPVCFIFEVEHGRVRRISVYRNDYGGLSG